MLTRRRERFGVGAEELQGGGFIGNKEYEGGLGVDLGASLWGDYDIVPLEWTMMLFIMLMAVYYDILMPLWGFTMDNTQLDGSSTSRDKFVPRLADSATSRLLPLFGSVVIRFTFIFFVRFRFSHQRSFAPQPVPLRCAAFGTSVVQSSHAIIISIIVPIIVILIKGATRS